MFGLLQNFRSIAIFGYGQSGLLIGEDAVNEVGLEVLEELIPNFGQDRSGRINNQLKIYLFMEWTTWRG